MSERGRLSHVWITVRDGLRDARTERIRASTGRFLGEDPGEVRVARLFMIDLDLPDEELLRLAREGLSDRILDEVRVGEPVALPGFSRYVHVSWLPGVTDDEARSAEATLAAMKHIQVPPGTCSSQTLVLFTRPFDHGSLRGLAEKVLGNPNVHHLAWGSLPVMPGYHPRVDLALDARVEPIPLPGLDGANVDEALAALSRSRALGLSVPELRAIARHLAEPSIQEGRARRGVGPDPTDCELEIFAQTWSEHCKHKEFNATIRVDDRSRGIQREVRSLFKSFIRASTLRVREELAGWGKDFIVTVFDDNAGLVRIDDERLLAIKVETHNSPSALDPYGGAITGILGCNRDALGTGKGGARLLFNTDVLCFGMPDHDGPLLPGQLHPARVFSGVREGIQDGGNKSGVPTVNGALLFDPRFSGKPLVFCGSAALMPRVLAGAPSQVKDLRPGDRIVTVGGRVGKDGIHGATFSSSELREGQSHGVVQVGSPITQKRVADFLEEACALGLVAAVTDSGAGGLSSSVGELARLSGGADVRLERVPLKYPGLRPWEVFLSESQERMTLAVRPEELQALSALSEARGVELADLGSFTDTGLLEVRHEGALVCSLDLAFLHEGVPGLVLDAVIEAPQALAITCDPGTHEAGDLLLRILASPNVCSRESIVRQYDHEVKGKTVVKPYMGPRGKAPQDAAVLRIDHRGPAGVAVASGIAPKFGDIDAYAMAQGAFDEALRSLVSVGARLPSPGSEDHEPFCGCDNFCVPDSVFDPDGNPDGREKLGKLVRMCEALYDMATFFRVPMVSGKDSMKNDLRAGGRKISVPPTVLFTMVAKIRDVRRAVTSELKAEGDVIFLLGETRDELGASELLRLLDDRGGQAPGVHMQPARDLYERVARAHDEGLLVSSHDLSDGGLAVALAESAIGGGLGAEISLPTGLPPPVQLFSESHSRLLVSARPDRAGRLAELFGQRATRLGAVILEPRLTVRGGEDRAGREILSLPLARLEAAYDRELLP